MQIALPLKENKGLDSAISAIFGRCPFFMVIDPETKTFSIESNPAVNASGGAGIQAAQWIIDKKVDALICKKLGPKAHDVLKAGKVVTYKFDSGTLKETLNAFNSHSLENIFEPNVDAHSGMQE